MKKFLPRLATALFLLPLAAAANPDWSYRPPSLLVEDKDGHIDSAPSATLAGDSVLFQEPGRPDRKVAVADLRRMGPRDHGRGSAKGMCWGMLVGGSTGMMLGFASGDSPDEVETGWFSGVETVHPGMKAGTKAGIGAAVGLVGGAILGGVIGGIRGSADAPPR